MTQREIGDGHVPVTRPEDNGLEAPPGARREVRRRGGERHLRPDWRLGLGELVHEPVVEGRVGQHVSERGTSRKHAILDSQVRLAVGHGVDGPVPPVHGAVVQRQLGQVRCPAPVEHRDGVLVVAEWQQRGKVPQVLLEQLGNRLDPSFAEPDSRPDSLALQFLRAGVGRLLEQRDPGLAPQLAAEQVRGVRAETDLDAGDGLRRVPIGAEHVGADLEMALHARASRFGKDVIDISKQPFPAVDADPHFLAAGGQHLIVQQFVARVGRDGVSADVAVPQAREYPDHEHPAAGLLGALERVRQCVLDARLEQ